jgi:cobyrinic acid a,c-diamide synthase
MAGVVIAGTHSGCGKTTVTLGVLAALKKRGMQVQAFKAGPDFIDSGLHRMITGRSSRNLDLWMCGEEYVKRCYSMHSTDVDISVVEGVMGLFDGALNTASLASHLGLPVVLVVDSYGMAETAGAIVNGFRDWGLGISKETNPQPLTTNPLIMGVIFNRVASDNHYRRLHDAVRDVPVLGYLPRELEFEIPHRHLGLTVAEEDPISKEGIDRLADTVLKYIDIEAIIRQGAKGKGQEAQDHKSIAHRPPPIASIAVAYDEAFCFYYEDNLDLLKDAGAEVVRFSPLRDASIPENADAVYIGGGYPELHAAQLSKNIPMLESFRKWAAAGRPLYAECGGLMYLSKGIHDFEGNFFGMTGVFPFGTKMKKGRSKLGYREVSLNEDCILGKKGAVLRGHEFHYSEISRNAETEKYGSTEGTKETEHVYSIRNGAGEELHREGYRINNVLASYIHVHFGSGPEAALSIVRHIRRS